MIDIGGEGDAASAVAALTCAVDDLTSVALTSLPGSALIEVAHLVETQLRRMASFDHALVAALVGLGAVASMKALSNTIGNAFNSVGNGLTNNV